MQLNWMRACTGARSVRQRPEDDSFIKAESVGSQPMTVVGVLMKSVVCSIRVAAGNFSGADVAYIKRGQWVVRRTAVGSNATTDDPSVTADGAAKKTSCGTNPSNGAGTVVSRGYNP